MVDDVRISAHAGTRSVDRAVSLLRLLAERGGLGLGEIARTLAIPKSSAADVLRALVARDFVAQDESGRCCLGLGTFEIGASYLRAMTPVAAVEPELKALTSELCATSHFAVLDGGDGRHRSQIGRTDLESPESETTATTLVLGDEVPCDERAKYVGGRRFRDRKRSSNLTESEPASLCEQS